MAYPIDLSPRDYFSGSDIMKNFNALLSTTDNPLDVKFGTLETEGDIYVRGSSLHKTQLTNVADTSTTDVFLFRGADGGVLNGTYSGHIYITIVQGGNIFTGIYEILTVSNGTTGASLVQETSATRGTNPLSSLTISNDGGSGAVKIQFVKSGSVGTVDITCTFIGVAS